MHWEVMGQIPGEGTYLSFGSVPVGVPKGGSQPMYFSHIDVSLSPPNPRLPPSLKSIFKKSFLIK